MHAFSHAFIVLYLVVYFAIFNVSLEDEPFVKVKRSFAISVGAVTSFGYQKDMDGQWMT